MHILIATHDFYPDPGSGGTGRYVYETARRLGDRGHDITVITRRRSSVPSRETFEGIDLYRYDISIAERSAPTILPQLPRATIAVSRHVRSAINSTGMPDIASYQGPVTSALVERALGAEGTPRVATFHSPWPVEYRVKTRGPEGAAGPRRNVNIALRWIAEKYVLSRTDHIVTLSEYMREKFHQLYGRSPHTTVIPGGVDTELFTPDGPTSDRLEGDPVFLTVRRLSNRMGHGALLEAFATVTERSPTARLYIAGDGPLRNHLESVAHAHGVSENTTFLGYIPDEELQAVYRSADVFVLPTRNLEGFGLATLEALASGVPVVATPVGGTVELLSDLEAQLRIPVPMLLSTVTADALAHGMLEWTVLSAEKRSAVAQTCRQYVLDRFTWDKAVNSLETLYRNMIRDRVDDTPLSTPRSPVPSKFRLR